MSTEDPNIGILVNGRYLIEREIGRGGLGVVYLARDQQLLAKPAVIKILHERSFLDEWAKRKFRQELEALTRIDHPGIVRVLDAGEMPDGEPFFVMQFVDGVTLRSLISSNGLDLEMVAEIMRQLGQALSASHEKGVYHRDLKPANIMVQTMSERDIKVTLIDFGIARVENSQTDFNTLIPQIVGTLPYMSPEQLMSQPVNAVSDIFSLGVIAYEIITGKLPFRPESIFKLLELQREGVLVKPLQLRSNLPAAAQQVVLKALAFDPAERYQHARDFGEELANAILKSEATQILFTDKPVSELNIMNFARSEIRSEVKAETTRPPTHTGLPGRHTGAHKLMHTAIEPGIISLHVMIINQSGVSDDQKLLTQLEEELTRRGHQVFINDSQAIGVEWAKEMTSQLQQADIVLPLISTTALENELFLYQVQLAHETSQRQFGRPLLLPIKIDLAGQLSAPRSEPLVSLLAQYESLDWHSQQDNSAFVWQMLTRMQTLPHTQTSQLRRLEPVGGAVPLDSKFYIERATDDEFISAIEHGDSIVLIKGARQMGKTSLLARGLQKARARNARVVLTDFQKLNATHLESLDALFFMLAELIADQLDIDLLPEDIWRSQHGPNRNFERFWREVLANIKEHIVWGMDEVDRLFSCAFAGEVFGLFRAWHNEWSMELDSPWRRLTLAISYATEAHLFISDIRQSPFNVGTRLNLEDFDFEMVAELNRRYGSPLRDKAEQARFFRLVGGHPYLVRRSLYEMATRRLALANFETLAVADDGPFGEHLCRILILIAQDSELSEALRGVVQGRACPNSESFYRLRSAGVILGSSARDARPRCQLYASYLERHLL